MISSFLFIVDGAIMLLIILFWVIFSLLIDLFVMMMMLLVFKWMMDVRVIIINAFITVCFLLDYVVIVDRVIMLLIAVSF